MWQMQNEIIRLRRGDDLSSRNSLQGGGAPNLRFISRTKEAHWSEVPPTPNRVPRSHDLNIVIMDEAVEQ